MLKMMGSVGMNRRARLRAAGLSARCQLLHDSKVEKRSGRGRSLRGAWIAAIVFALLLAPGASLAGGKKVDPRFKRALPGKPLKEKELATFYGRGVNVTVNSGDGSIISPGGPLAVNDIDQILSLQNTSGITGAFTTVGDNNTINMNVIVEVNLNTVTVQDTAGTVVNVNQTLDFGGGVIQALGN